MWLITIMIIMRHGAESIHYHVHNTKFASLQGPVNPFTALACKMSGLCEKCTYTPANSIFSGTITNLLSVQYCALWWKSVRMLMWKREQKGLRIPHLYWPFSSDITAVERLKGISPSHSDDHNLQLTTFFSFLFKLQHCEQRPGDQHQLNISILIQHPHLFTLIFPLQKYNMYPMTISTFFTSSNFHFQYSKNKTFW